MRVLITDWALDAYAEMVGRDFSEEEYWAVLRPDILRLYARTTDIAFNDAHFWGPAQSGPSRNVPDGFKMKWRNIGSGRVQLRLCVALVEGNAWLCDAYSKTDPRQDYRMGVRLIDRIQSVRDGDVVVRGVLRERRT
jgi:hypothetical protein